MPSIFSATALLWRALTPALRSYTRVAPEMASDQSTTNQIFESTSKVATFLSDQ